MKVKTYCINKDQTGQYFGLMDATDNRVLYGAPNNWKTERGAKNWARKNGMELVEGGTDNEKGLV